MGATAAHTGGIDLVIREPLEMGQASRISDEEDERFDYRRFMARYQGTSLSQYKDGQIVYAQGDAADALHYVIDGTVKATIVSKHGKEGVIALLGAGSFFGKDCLYAPQRVATITAIAACNFVRIPLALVTRALREDPSFTKPFLSYALGENTKLREELIAHLFNSSEKRLARILLALANAGPDDASSVIAMPITQETLAQMVGTTRARINQFMRKFSKLGYVDYHGAIRVNRSLSNILVDGDDARDVCC